MVESSTMVYFAIFYWKAMINYMCHPVCGEF
jgi:hypothetical protein